MGRHEKLIEKSLLKHDDWTSMRDNYKKNMQQQLGDAQTSELPEHLKSSIAAITDHTDKYLSVNDIDAERRERMGVVFKQTGKKRRLAELVKKNVEVKRQYDMYAPGPNILEKRKQARLSSQTNAQIRSERLASLKRPKR